MKNRIKLSITLILVLASLLGLTRGIIACDTWVALSNATSIAFTILAKNSDRPIYDCQPLVFYPRKKWPSGTILSMGRISIPQAEETYATLGSSPYWCWGYEEGINEYGVAIGNEGIFSKTLDEAIKAYKEGKGPDLGPTGMDLLRLGLERGKTAREALDVITDLVEKYGQFGSGIPDQGIEGAYDNSYIIADATEAWVLETAGKRWIARRFTKGITSISNKLSIRTEWDLASPDLIDHAISKEWWTKGQRDSFNFEKAYSLDTGLYKMQNSRAHARQACSQRLLEEKKGKVTPRWMMRIARDRSSNPSIDLDQTASSCVAILPNTPDEIPVFWWCAATPSSSCYVPFFVNGSRLPEIVSTTGPVGKNVIPPSEVEPDSFSDQSYWWLFRDLCDQVNLDWKERNAIVRAEFDALEEEFAAGLPAIMIKAVELRRAGKEEAAAKILDEYTAQCIKKSVAKVNELRGSFGAIEIPDEYIPYVGSYLANFGPYKNAKFGVLFRNNSLAVDIPNQAVVELKNPDEEGLWYFTVSPTVAVSFIKNEEGQIQALKFHQAIVMPRKKENNVLPPEDVPVEFKSYVGKYKSPMGGEAVTVLYQKGHLAMDIPNQILVELVPPDKKGRWAFKIDASTAVSFAINKSGKVTALRLHQTFELPRDKKELVIPKGEAGAKIKKGPPTLDQRLERLVQQLEEKRQEHHIPGMAIAVVKNDKVILAKAFGLADIARKKPVTTETLFSIGSTTKAFTGALVGMLVDDGIINWDDPVTKHLPYFTMNIKTKRKDAVVTIRDLLCHRTGFTRMGILYSNGAVPREEILHTATKAEPWDGYRRKWYYSNIMFMAAGVAAGKAAGTDWDSLIKERIFGPLGMKNSTTSINHIQKDDSFSLGYLWEEDLETYRELPRRVVDNVGPAGSIVSTVLDMAQWVRFQLGRGEFEGKRLLSETQHKETWKRQMKIEGGAGYGFGWILSRWEKQRVITHGGNTDGFAAQVALLPESNLGFVLLANVTATPLQELALNMVWESLIGEWRTSDSETAALDLEPYLGKYNANFGPHKDTEFTVFVKKGQLAIDVPGQTVYELRQSDEAGKWHFAASSQISVTFDRDKDEQIIAMKIHQPGITLSLPRIGIERAPEIPLNQLDMYLGSYYGEKMDETVELVIKNNSLALRIPGQKTYELRAPNEEGKWLFLVTDSTGISFKENEAGEVESMTYYEGGQRMEYVRLKEDSGQRLPTIEEILILRKQKNRKNTFKKLGGIRLSGTVHRPHSGLSGKIVWHINGLDFFREDQDFGKYGSLQGTIKRGVAMSKSPHGRVDELRGRFYEQEKHRHPAIILGDWNDFFESAEILSQKESEGRKVYLLALKGKDAPSYTLTLDAETGDILKLQTTIMIRGTSSQPPITFRYEDYRDVHGLRIPFRVISESEHQGSIISEFDKLETGLQIQDTLFDLKKEDNE
ncbi:serine hydrolase [Acidobacteriota bacterium]